MFNNLLLGTGAIVGIVAGAVALLLLVVFIWYVATFNKLKRLKNLVDEGWATIDVQLKKRYDLIPNLVETVKGYAKHESGTLEAVIRARSAAINAKGDDRIAAENALTGTLKSLFKLKESYPELKANGYFMSLQSQLSEVETELASARRYYNGTVKEYNTSLDYFFTGMVARKMKLEIRAYFEVDDEEERKAPAVRF